MAKLKKGKQKGPDEPKDTDPPSRVAVPVAFREPLAQAPRIGQAKAGHFKEEFSQEGSIRQDQSIHGRVGALYGSGEGTVAGGDDDGWGATAGDPWGPQVSTTPTMSRGAGSVIGANATSASEWEIENQGEGVPGGWGDPNDTVQHTTGGLISAKSGRTKKKGAIVQGAPSSPPPLTIPPPPPPPPAAPPPSLAAAAAAVQSGMNHHQTHYQAAADAGFESPQVPANDDWGDPSDGWGDVASEPTPWGVPAAPPPPPQMQLRGPAAAPHSNSAWSKWANEAKTLPKVAASVPIPAPPGLAPLPSGVTSSREIPALSHQQANLHSLLTQPNQGRGVSVQIQARQLREQLHAQRQQQQMYLQQEHLRQQQQQQNHSHPQRPQRGRQRDHHTQQQGPSIAQHLQPQQIEQSDSWGSTGWGGGGGGGRGSDWADPIPEEDEEEEEEDMYEDEEEEEEEEEAVEDYDHGYGHGYGHRVRFSPQDDYQYGYVENTQPSVPPPAPSPAPPRQQPLWTDPVASKTMSMAVGRPSTVFELVSPRNENHFVQSYGAALEHAQRALFGNGRPAKERIYWGLSPDKDQRVSSLLRWIHIMSNGLATIGLERFLQTGERGALISNADYRSNISGSPVQPAFDWVPIEQLQRTLDHMLQESVALYDPALLVIVYVFLLSKTGNSLAVWRRKLAVPETVRLAHEEDILRAKEMLKTNYSVYVDELPVKPEAKSKQKKRGFFSRLFRW